VLVDGVAQVRTGDEIARIFENSRHSCTLSAARSNSTTWPFCHTREGAGKRLGAVYVGSGGDFLRVVRKSYYLWSYMIHLLDSQESVTGVGED
jgi:hypothetical protein